MKKIILAAAASAAFFAATPAFAQVAAPVGGRAELLVGYDRVKALGEHDSGILFGIGGGYDFAVSNGMSLGLDVEASGSTQKERQDDALVKAKRDLYAGARLNFAVSEAANVYVKAGYSNARFRAELDGLSASENFDGIRVGAGAQFRITGKTYVGGEYRYSNYEAGLTRHQVAMTLGSRF